MMMISTGCRGPTLRRCHSASATKETNGAVSASGGSRMTTRPNFSALFATGTNRPRTSPVPLSDADRVVVYFTTRKGAPARTPLMAFGDACSRLNMDADERMRAARDIVFDGGYSRVDFPRSGPLRGQGAFSDGVARSRMETTRPDGSTPVVLAREHLRY